MEDIQRPTAKETDEDLLRQQELFFKNNNKTSLNVQSKEIQGTSLKESKANALKVDETEADLKCEKLDYSFEIKEKITSTSDNFTFKPPSSKVVDVLNMRDKKLNQNQFASKKKKKSIFAQLLEKTEHEPILAEKLPDAIYKSSLVDGSGLDTKEQDKELEKIHEENLAKLSSMSKEEILAHQMELKSQLDPTLIRFIKSRSDKRKVDIRSQNTVVSSDHSSTVELPGEVLRKEGRNDCDALILEKAKECELAAKNIPHRSENSLKNKDIEIPVETKQLLESRDKGKWVNMRKIEKEKLEWISDLPKTNPIDLKTGFTARFDFEGLLLAHDVDTPTFKGLHHHGEEPEVAGYSLEELFLLGRSTLQSQRITALHTIAHILDNYWSGLFDGCFDDPLLPTMLDAGLVPLLRWALDDTSLTSLAATITAMHSLLISKIDELCLQRTFCWLNGHVIPLLKPENLVEPDIVPEELTDADLIKLDVIKAFLQMDILPRFSYILKALQPPPLVCKLVIEICTHISQHSLESAEQIVKFPGFLDFIIEKFLPTNWQSIDGSKLSDSVGYKSPLPSAMKLMRIIYSTHKELVINSNFNLIPHVLEYLALNPSEWKSTADDMHLLMIEALKTAHVLFCYNIRFSELLPIFPVFLRQMDFCVNLDLSSERSKHLKDFEYATHLFKTLEALTVVSVHRKNIMFFEDSSIIKKIFDKALLCLKKWLWQFPQENPSDHGIMLLSGCMNFVSTYYQKVCVPNIFPKLKPCSETMDLFQKYLLPCVNSEVFQRLLTNIESYSLLLHSGKSGNFRDSKTIVSLGSILWKEDINPILKENSPIPLLLAVLKLSGLQRDVLAVRDNTVLQELLNTSSFSKYFKRISSEKLNADCWFARYESYLISQVVLLPSAMIVRDVLLWHSVASSLLPILRTPDESIVQDLFENIIFNHNFLLSIENRHSEDDTIKKLIGNLPIISFCYSTNLLDDEQISHSRKLLNAEDCFSMAVLSKSQFILTKDWFYTPIWDTYQNSIKKTSDKKLTTDDNLELASSFEWILLSHKLRLPLLKGIPGAVEFCYLCMVFLLDEDFFLNPEIRYLLEECLSTILKYKKIRLTNIKWSTLDRFDDLYLEMLNQFEAVSYGDEVFGNFLVFSLQQCYPSSWKKLLLTEHSQLLHFLRVPLSKLFVPVKYYLEPFEKEFSVLAEYFKLLASGSLTFVRCPLIYIMAIHHVHNFIFSKQDELKSKQKWLISNLFNLKRKIVKRHILLYSEVNLDVDCGFTTHEELSADYENHLRSIVGGSLNLGL